MKSRHITFLVLTGLLVTAGVVGVSAQNYKIKQVSTMMGQKMESTVYVKAPRKRTEGGGIMGIGADVATIEQCDLKRTIKLNDKRRIYTVEPFAVPSDEASPATPQPRPKPQPQERAEKGGTMTMTSRITDTGERKQMFGFTARHIKTSMKMESSPDACSQMNMQVETDGWYIDLPQYSCPVNTSYSPPPQYEKPTRSGCRDKVVVRSSGGGRLGFALQETQTMDGGQGQSFTRSMETVELSRATLDDALFDIPANYKLAENDQAIYKPDMGEMRKAANEALKNGSGGEMSTMNPGMNGQETKRPGVKRIGVLVPTNGTSENVATGELRAILIQQLGSGNVEAVALNNAADAGRAGCDYVLTSSVSRLKQSTAGKIGGFLGKVTNTDTSQSSTWDMQIDFNLTTANGQSVLSRSVNDKVKGSVEMASSSVLSKEAAAVRSAIR